MKRLECKTARFLFSSNGSQFPKDSLQHIVFVGRSNVGKSSMISQLVQKKNFAKASSTPGKTKLINFFLIDENFYFVDLPGFGWAKTSKKLQNHWKNLIETYIEKFQENIFFVHLIDARHDLMQQDHAFLEFSQDFPTCVVFTKVDSLPANKREHLLSQKAKKLHEEYPHVDFDLAFSIKLSYLHKPLIRNLNDWIQKYDIS